MCGPTRHTEGQESSTQAPLLNPHFLIWWQEGARKWWSFRDSRSVHSDHHLWSLHPYSLSHRMYFVRPSLDHQSAGCQSGQLRWDTGLLSLAFFFSPCEMPWGICKSPPSMLLCFPLKSAVSPASIFQYFRLLYVHGLPLGSTAEVGNVGLSSSYLWGTRHQKFSSLDYSPKSFQSYFLLGF